MGITRLIPETATPQHNRLLAHNYSGIGHIWETYADYNTSLGFPETRSNDCLIMDTKSCAKQRETLEDAEGQACTVWFNHALPGCWCTLIVKQSGENGRWDGTLKTGVTVLELINAMHRALCKWLHRMESDQKEHLHRPRNLPNMEYLLHGSMYMCLNSCAEVYLFIAWTIWRRWTCEVAELRPVTVPVVLNAFSGTPYLFASITI